MGLQATIEAGVATAFLAVGDLAVVMPLQDPSTMDAVTEIEVPGATGTVKVIQLTQMDAEKYGAGLNWRGVAGDVQASDVFLLADLASATVTVKQGQTATWNGSTYQVHMVQDIQRAALMLSLRRPV